LTFLVDG